MKKFNSIISAFIFSVATVSCLNATPKDNSTQKAVQSKNDGITKVNHSVFEKLLQANVSDKGSVNYKAFLKDKAILDNYIKSLTKVSTIKLSKNEKTAFWINVYNALTIDQIVRNYRVASITEIAGGKVWDLVLPYKFAGKTITLNDLEKNILLGGDLFDARIHFALNCAALSCPSLSNHAFTGDNVQQMLTKKTQLALADSSLNKISAKSAALSKLFDWYKADFIKAEGSIVKFINKYATTKINDKTKITYLDYNWSLNGK